MTTTLLDEEFQRLNDQLLELKSHNYNIEINLRKALAENRILKSENEQLRKRLPSQVETRKSLNPLAFAKSIATKVDSRLHQLSSSGSPVPEISPHQQQQSYDTQPEPDLKGQIVTMQSKIQQLELENSQRCHLDSSFGECLSILKASINQPIITETIDRNLVADLPNRFEYERRHEELNKIDDFKTFCNELDRYYQEVVSNLEAINVHLFEKLKELTAKQVEPAAEAGSPVLDQCRSELTTVQQQLAESKRNYEDKIKEHQREIEDLKQRHQENISVLSVKLDQTSVQMRELQRQTDLLQNQLSECQNEKKISEKRGFKIIKELKKQLQVEKNRADKLQKILNNEPLDSEKSFDMSSATPPNGGGGASDKGSSTGSWSYMNEPVVQTKPGQDPEFSDLEICDDINGDQSHRRPRALTLEQENTQLLEKISSLQQEKWSLEERINQLERELSSSRRSTPASPSSPSSKLAPSAALINNSILKVINYIREKSDQHHQQHQDSSNSKQINEAHRKLQRMVEEILTKNMHLQASLEEMSNELALYKKQYQIRQTNQC